MKTVKVSLCVVLICLLCCFESVTSYATVIMTKEPDETYYFEKGGRAVLTCSAESNNSEAAIRYQWNELESTDDKIGTVVSSLFDNSSSFSPDTSETGTYYYMVRAFEYLENSGTGSVAKSKVIKVVVMDGAVKIDAQPVGVNVFSGDDVTISCSASSNLSDTKLRYQWFRADRSDSYDGAIAKNLNTLDNNFYPDTSVEGTKYYFCRVSAYSGTTKIGEVDSDIIKVQVTRKTEPEIITQPQSRAVMQFDVLRLSIEAEIPGNAEVEYGWFMCDDARGTNSVQIQGVYREQFLPPTDSIGEFFYYCTVTSGNSSVTSETVKVTVSDSAETVNSINSELDQAEPTPSPTEKPEEGSGGSGSTVPWWAAVIIIFAAVIICEIAITHKKKK